MTTSSDSERSTSVVMALTTASRLLGFVRQAVVNAVFGATGNADVLNAVFNIPNNLRKLLAEGALSSAFIPVLAQAHGDPEARAAGEPRAIVRNLLGFQYIVIVPLLILSVLFAGPITRTILDFPEPERQALAAGLFRWFIHYTLLISVSAVAMGTLNSAGRFTIPALTPIVFSVCVISSLVLLGRSLGVYAMVVGVALGGAAQVLFQLPQFRREGFTLLPSFDFANPYFRRILKRWLPVVAASSAFAINQQVALYYASGLESGSSSALANAVIFWQLPQGIFAASVTTVLFPRMSREAGRNDTPALRETLGYGLKSITALLIPSSILLGVFGSEVVAMAFQRGNFGVADTLRTAHVLAYYCVGMVGVSVYAFLQRFFYASGDYRTPTFTAMGVLLLNAALSIWLKETALAAAGLALANSIAFSTAALALALIARARLSGISGRAVATNSVKAVLATFPGATLLVVVRTLAGPWWQPGSSVAGFAALTAIGLSSLALTAVGFVVLKVEGAEAIIRRLTRGRK